MIVNPGAWSHYSYAIRDALEPLQVPIVEVHLSNIEEREEWRRHSVVADLAALRVIGEGPDGYRRALEFLAGKEERSERPVSAISARGSRRRCCHEPDERLLPDRLRQLERRAARAAGRRGDALHRLSLHRGGRRLVDGVEVVLTKRAMMLDVGERLTARCSSRPTCCRTSSGSG